MPIFNTYPAAAALDGTETTLIWQTGAVKQLELTTQAAEADPYPEFAPIREGFVTATRTTAPVPYKILVLSTSIGGFGSDPGLPWVHRLGGFLSQRYNVTPARLQTVGTGLVAYTNTGTSSALGNGVGATARSIPDGTVITQTFTYDPVDSVLAMYATQVGGGTLEIRRNGVLAGSVSTNAAETHGNILASDVGTLVAGHSYTFGAVGGPVTLELIQAQAGQRTAGVETMVVSSGGNSIQDILTNPDRALVVIETYEPDLVIIDLGTLDNAVDIPADVALMQTAVESRLKVGAMWMWTAPYRGASTTYDDNRAVIDTCESLGIPVLDFAEPVGVLSALVPGSDGVHPSINDSEKMARYVFSAFHNSKEDLAQLYGMYSFPISARGTIAYDFNPYGRAYVGGVAASLPFASVGVRPNLLSDWASAALVDGSVLTLLGGRARGGLLLGVGGTQVDGFVQNDLIAGRERFVQGGIAVSGSAMGTNPQGVGSAEWNTTFVLASPQSTTTIRTAGVGTAAVGVGTVSHPAPTAAGYYTNIVNIAGAASIAEVRLGAAIWRRGATTDQYGGFWGHSRVVFPDVSYDETGAGTGTRLIPLSFCGSNAAALYPAARATGLAVAMFTREHVNAGNLDTNWMFVTNDGGVVPTTVDTGMAFTPGSVYEFYIGVEAGGARIYGTVVNVTLGTTVHVSSTTDLPGATTFLFLSSGLTVLEAVTTRNFRFSRLYAEAVRG